MLKTPMITAAAFAVSLGFVAGVAEAGPQSGGRVAVVGSEEFAAGLQVIGDERIDRRGKRFGRGRGKQFDGDHHRRRGHGKRFDRRHRSFDDDSHHGRKRHKAHKRRHKADEHHARKRHKAHKRRHKADEHHARKRHKALKRKHKRFKRRHHAKRFYRHGYRGGHGYRHRPYAYFRRHYHDRPWFRAWVGLRHLDFLHRVHPLTYRSLWLSHYRYYPDCHVYRPHSHGRAAFFRLSVGGYGRH